jgi:adenosylcobyric acid synthase
MPAVMIQGCGSDVGKSILVAGLCRLFANRGLSVRPFKPQNMSNNAAVTDDGGEIGRAQALQAMACRVPPSVDMNPVLLKPHSDTGAQVIVRGKVAGAFEARAYQQRKPDLLPVVVDSFRRLERDADLVIVEGAGSPAETNLRTGDIANMGFARAIHVPVILAGDIDRGHVIASLVGAHAVLDADDRAMIRGFIVNKFRGDARLFDDGRAEIARRTGWADFGLVPWLPAAARLPAEDAVVLDRTRASGAAEIRIAVPMLSRIANFDDFDPLRAAPHVKLDFIPPGTPLPGDANLVILPGTKATLADLAFARSQGWDIDLAAHVRRGGRVLGICGGFQMLGQWVDDPDGIEGAPASAAGFGLLDVVTRLTPAKVVQSLTGTLCESGGAVDGYEIHAGRTTGPGLARPFLTRADGAPDGAISADGRVAGTYAHGLFNTGAARAQVLQVFGAATTDGHHSALVDAALDELANALADALDIPAIAALAGLAKPV